MQFLLLLLMLTGCAAGPQDLSGKMFTFPEEGAKSHVRLNAPQQTFSAVTVCHRSFTDLERTHVLFSLSTRKSVNSLVIIWVQKDKKFWPHVLGKKTGHGVLDYKPSTWHSICTTWDSASGLVQVWVDGQPLTRKFISGSSIKGTPIIMLGQEQDSYGGRFNAKESFVGMMTDVHMWDYVLSPCEIQNYMNEENFTPGNVINWKALDFEIKGRVLTEDMIETCGCN